MGSPDHGIQLWNHASHGDISNSNFVGSPTRWQCAGDSTPVVFYRYLVVDHTTLHVMERAGGTFFFWEEQTCAFKKLAGDPWTSLVRDAYSLHNLHTAVQCIPCKCSSRPVLLHR